MDVAPRTVHEKAAASGVAVAAEAAPAAASDSEGRPHGRKSTQKGHPSAADAGTDSVATAIPDATFVRVTGTGSRS